MFRRSWQRATLSANATRLAVLVQEVLSLDDRWLTDGNDTQLLGAIPQLDSMAAVALLTELELRFDIRIADDDVSATMFTTFGHLLDFVEARMVDTTGNEHSRLG
jgi:acyl carrier protein